MGEEWGEARPFCFFTDFHGELAHAVREGRRNEFRKWPAFQDPGKPGAHPRPQCARNVRDLASSTGARR